jgi:hypothetical protein
MAEFIEGFNKYATSFTTDTELQTALGRKTIEGRVERYLTRLVDHTVSSFMKLLDERVPNLTTESEADMINELHAAFDAARYRTDFIWDVELRKANAFGSLMGVKATGGYGIQLKAADGACEKCQAADGRIIGANYASVDDMPPLHPNSRMEFKVIQDILTFQNDVKDSTGEGSAGVGTMSGGVLGGSGAAGPSSGAPLGSGGYGYAGNLPSPGNIGQPPSQPPGNEISSACPHCTSTAVWQPRIGHFYCPRCTHIFRHQNSRYGAG